MRILIIILLLINPTLVIAEDRKISENIYEIDQPPLRINLQQKINRAKIIQRELDKIDQESQNQKQPKLDELSEIQKEIDRGAAVGTKPIDITNQEN